MKNSLTIATIVFAGATLVFSNPARVAAAPAAPLALKVSPKKTTLDAPAVAIRLRRVASQYIFDAELNGHGPWRFIVDLAHQHTVLDDNIVAALKLTPTATPGVHIDNGKPRTVDVVSIDSFEIDEASFSGFDAVVSDLDALAGGVRTYDGVLGFSLFADLVLMVDHSGGRMVLRKGAVDAVDGKEILDMVKGEYGVAVTMSLSGTATPITLDTLSLGAFTLPASMRNKVGVTPRLEGDFRSQKTITEVDLDAQAIKGTVRIGKFALTEPPVVFDGERATVGLEVLDRFTVSIDQKHRRVKLERFKDDPISFPIRSKWGLVFVRRGDKLEVVKILAGSVAERSIIHEGDIVTSFVGRPLDRVTDADIVALMKQRNQIHVTILRSGFPLMVPLDLE